MERQSATDLERVDALTDQDALRRAQEDPDARPTDASFWAGEELNAEGEEVCGVEDIFGQITPAQVLRGLRHREGLKQKDLAATLGIRPANLSEMEHGRRPIGKDMAKRLAKVLGTDWKVLL